MNCQACQIEIEEIELGEPLSAAASAHISACPACRAFHDERQSLRKLVGGLGTVAAPSDFEFRLRARLAAAQNGGSRHHSLRSFLASAPAIALAASFAVLVAGVIIYQQVKSGTTTSQPTEVAQSGAAKNANVEAKPSPATTAPTPDNGNSSTPVIQTTGGQKTQPPLTANNRNPARRQFKSVENAQQIVSNTVSVKGAQRITPSNNSSLADGSGQPVQLSVRSPMQPVRVSLDDKSGAKRTVTLAPVVFGSQDFTGRNLTRNASPSDIW